MNEVKYVTKWLPISFHSSALEAKTPVIHSSPLPQVFAAGEGSGECSCLSPLKRLAQSFRYFLGMHEQHVPNDQ
jgi:hypothetical protein